MRFMPVVPGSRWRLAYLKYSFSKKSLLYSYILPLAFETDAVIVEQMSSCGCNHYIHCSVEMVHPIVLRKVWTVSLEQMAWTHSLLTLTI